MDDRSGSKTIVSMPRITDIFERRRGRNGLYEPNHVLHRSKEETPLLSIFNAKALAQVSRESLDISSQTIDHQPTIYLRY